MIMTLSQHDLMIVSKYLISTTDYTNLIKTCKEYKQILNSYSYNPIYFNDENEAVKIFPNIKTFNNYFHIIHNGYIITNPYFLSLYSAFALTLPKLMKEIRWNIHICGIDNKCEEGEKYKQILNNIEKLDSIIYCNLRYETSFDDNGFIGSIINFNVNKNYET